MADQLVCPNCSSVFRKGISQCPTCKIDLVSQAQFAAEEAWRKAPQAALKDKKTVVILHAGLAACREIERALLDADVPCFVSAEAEEGEPLAPGALKVGVVIAEEDAQRASTILRQRFMQLIAQEGAGAPLADVVDLSAAEVTCPACGHKGALVNGECSDCGLFLGEPV